MSRKVGKAALLGFAAGALQGVGQFLQTRAAQEAERLREERLAAIRAEERSQDRSFQESRDSSQRAFNLEIMGRQEAAQAQRDDKQHIQRLAEIKQQGRNTQEYVAATQRPPQARDLAPVRVLVRMPDGAESVVDAASIPAGAQSIAAFSASGQPTRLTGSPAPRAATAATEAPARGATSTQPEVIGRWVPELGRFVSPAEEAQMKQQGR